MFSGKKQRNSKTKNDAKQQYKSIMTIPLLMHVRKYHKKARFKYRSMGRHEVNLGVIISVFHINSSIFSKT